MPNPDAGSGGVIFADANPFPSVQQIEAKLTQTKHPMNPNGGYVSPGIDTSSPPPRHGGIDPTIAYYIDDELSFGDFLGGTITIIPGGGYTDPVRGWVPFTPEVNPNSGGGINPIAQPRNG